jgi:hypothetical protein
MHRLDRPQAPIRPDATPLPRARVLVSLSSRLHSLAHNLWDHWQGHNVAVPNRREPDAHIVRGFQLLMHWGGGVPE